MSETQTPDHGLILRAVRDEKDAAAFANASAETNSPGEGATCACLLRHFPGSSRSNYWIVEDEAAGRVAATVCLIPWTVCLDGVSLRAAMLEMVLSLPEYRRHGLVRKLIGRFHEEVASGRYDLSIITGIPYYYRQFGYAYCMDLGGEVVLDGSLAPAPQAGSAYMLRPAGTADIPALKRFYDRQMERQQVHIARDEAHWRYMLESALYDVRMLFTGKEKGAEGYVIVSGGGAGITESAVPEEAADAVLGLLAAGGRDLSVAWPEEGELARAARAMGGVSRAPSQWLVKLQEPAALLYKLAPAFERRLSASPFAGFNGTVIINFFRNAIRLAFENGRLEATENAGFVDSSMGADGGDLCIPPDAFVRLLFGWRTLKELRDAWPDIVPKKESRALVETLFPPLRSWLHTPYWYQGRAEEMLKQT